jgi:hypothetical protein
MVEIELSVLVRQCLKRRIPDIETLRCEAQAWCEERNRLGTSVDWRFTTADARIKLRKLYPSIDTCRRTRRKVFSDLRGCATTVARAVRAYSIATTRMPTAPRRAKMPHHSANDRATTLSARRWAKSHKACPAQPAATR